MTASLGAVKAYGYAEAEQSVLTDVQPAVAIEKQTSSIENASANGETGAHTGLQSVFSIQTNGTDSDYDFIITSKILTDGGEVSAYGNNGSLLFEGTVTHTVGQNPISGTYNIGQDQAGTYQAVVTFTAVSK